MRMTVLLASVAFASLSLSPAAEAQELMPALDQPAWTSGSPCNPIWQTATEIRWMACNGQKASCPTALEGPMCTVQVPKAGLYQLRLRFYDSCGYGGTDSGVVRVRFEGSVSRTLTMEWRGPGGALPFRNVLLTLAPGAYRFRVTGMAWAGCDGVRTTYCYVLRQASLTPVERPCMDVRWESLRSYYGVYLDILGQLKYPGSLGIVMLCPKTSSRPLAFAGVQGSLLLDPMAGIFFFPPTPSVNWRFFTWPVPYGGKHLQLLEVDPQMGLHLGPAVSI